MEVLLLGYVSVKACGIKLDIRVKNLRFKKVIDQTVEGLLGL
jgi:hypothetical protein